VVVRLRVGNLAFEIREAGIRAAFTRFGIVNAVQLVTDARSGNSLGVAFVTMGDEASARSALAWMDGALIGDRIVSVEEILEAREPERRGPTRGR